MASFKVHVHLSVNANSWILQTVKLFCKYKAWKTELRSLAAVRLNVKSSKMLKYSTLIMVWWWLGFSAPHCPRFTTNRATNKTIQSTKTQWQNSLVYGQVRRMQKIWCNSDVEQLVTSRSNDKQKGNSSRKSWQLPLLSANLWRREEPRCFCDHTRALTSEQNYLRPNQKDPRKHPGGLI